MTRDGCTSLWAAVINEAIHCAAAHWEVRDGKRKNYPSNMSGIEASEGWSFLTDSWGPWAASRRDICAAVRIDPCYLREKVLAAKARGELRSLHSRDLLDAVSYCRKTGDTNGMDE